MITYDDFAKLEIAIGEIKTVEIVENADKLLKLTVDVGEKGEDGNSAYRQIISGIREYYEDPQSLVGTKCPFLTNLEPRVIRGYESQGMILAAHNGENFALLVPSVDLPPGTKIK
jgi:methionine--tRNA ligase beta chain